jgi:hypothetical protein
MRTFLFALAVAVLAIAGATAWNPYAPVYTQHGFITGNRYLQMSVSERIGYIMGLIDGFFGAAFIGADQGVEAKLKTCVGEWTNWQMQAVFEKYLQANPKDWNWDADTLFWYAVERACNILPTPTGPAVATPR